MNTRIKLAILTVSLGALFQLGNCATFLGDVLGDVVWLRAID